MFKSRVPTSKETQRSINVIKGNNSYLFSESYENRNLIYSLCVDAELMSVSSRSTCSYHCSWGVSLKTLCVNQEVVCGERSVLEDVTLWRTASSLAFPRDAIRVTTVPLISRSMSSFFPLLNQLLSVVFLSSTSLHSTLRLTKQLKRKNIFSNVYPYLFLSLYKKAFKCDRK